MAKILIVDDEAVIREPIAENIRARGHQVACAANGQVAWARIHSSLPDLILLDLHMPGEDGLSILRELKATNATAAVPVLFLTNSSDRALVLEAASLGAQGYILKTAFSLNDLMARIARLCRHGSVARQSQAVLRHSPQDKSSVSSPSTELLQPIRKPSHCAAAKQICPDVHFWPKLLTREKTLARLNEVVGGKTLASVIARLISVASSPDSDLSDITRVIESDPILAARVLQLANNGDTSMRTRVENVQDAARNLGVRVIQNMATSIGIIEAFPPDSSLGFEIMRFWLHSYAVADLFSILMRPKNPEQEGIAHLMGLCHELGEILLRQYFVDEYADISQFATKYKIPVHKVQSVALGVPQPELTTRLLARMGLPPLVIKTIREFCEWQIRPRPTAPSPMVHALSLANIAAHGLLLSPSLTEVVRPITRAEWRQFAQDSPPPNIDPIAKRHEILTSTSNLARLPMKEEKRLQEPLLPRRSLKLWYVRSDAFIEFDPLAFTLSLTCELEMSRDIPQGKQWQGIDALVLVESRCREQRAIATELSRAAADAGRTRLPILILSSQEMVPDSIDSAMLRSYHLSFEDLGQWIGAIPNRT